MRWLWENYRHGNETWQKWIGDVVSTQLAMAHLPQSKGTYESHHSISLRAWSAFEAKALDGAPSDYWQFVELSIDLAGSGDWGEASWHGAASEAGQEPGMASWESPSQAGEAPQEKGGGDGLPGKAAQADSGKGAQADSGKAAADPGKAAQADSGKAAQADSGKGQAAGPGNGQGDGFPPKETPQAANPGKGDGFPQASHPGKGQGDGFPQPSPPGMGAPGKGLASPPGQGQGNGQDQDMETVQGWIGKKPAGDGWWHPKQEPEAWEGSNYPEKKHKGPGSAAGSAAGHSHAHGPQTFILGWVAPKCKQYKISYWRHHAVVD